MHGPDACLSLDMSDTVFHMSGRTAKCESQVLRYYYHMLWTVISEGIVGHQEEKTACTKRQPFKTWAGQCGEGCQGIAGPITAEMSHYLGCPWTESAD